ncbi:MAG: hypothetical protein ABI480_00165 [Chitinophagaceae bacterium]
MKEGAFDISFVIKVDKSSREYVIKDINVTLTNPYIGQLYNEKKLQLILKIGCTPTYKTWTVVDPIEIRLPENEIDLLLEVESFLITADKVDDYFDKTFGDVFDEDHFQLEKGDIVALTGSKKVMIPKENEKASLGSIFRFKKITPESDHQEMHFEFDEDQIVINYPSANRDYDPVTLLFDKKQGMPYMALSLYIIPALTEAFRIRMDEEEKSYSENKWFTILESILPDSEMSDDAFINAQRTIKTGLPLNMAFDEFINKNLRG